VLRRADAIDATIAMRLKAARKQAGLSQMEFAYALGISYQQYQKYERAQNRISGSVLFRSAEILNVPVDTLLPPRTSGEAQGAPSSGEDTVARSGGRNHARAGKLSDAPAGSVSVPEMFSEFRELCERIVALQSPRLKRALLEILQESCANDASRTEIGLSAPASAVDGSRKASA